MNPMFAEGLNLMLVGMGVVFAFLVMLVGVVSLMSTLVVRYAPDAPVVAPARAPSASPPAATPAVSDTTLAVIREAVRVHRDAR